MAGRERQMVVTLPLLCLASCLPNADLASFSEAREPVVQGADGDVGSEPLPVQPGTSNEGASPVGLVPSELTDAGTSGVAADAAQGDAALGSPCGPERSLGPNGNCYFVESQTRTWSQARASCRSLGEGWDLASIRSAEVSAFLAELSSIEAWVSASDADTEGEWTWTNGGDAFWSGDGTGDAVNAAYTNWNNDEPNGGEESDCARLLPRTEANPNRNAPWADMECSQQRGALCEGPLG